MEAAAPPPEKPSGPGPFRYRDFSLYQFARMLLIVGGQIVIVALQWQVYALTQSKLQLGMIGLAQFLPNILASLPAGHVADRVSRRGIVMVCALANAATISMLAWQALEPAPSLVLI
jgi:MFS family permease